MEIEKIVALVRDMPAWKQIVFSLTCCERMLPNYRSFNHQSGFGSPVILEDALSLAWDWVRYEKLDLNFKKIREQIEEQAPNTEDFSSPFTSAALDAANSIATVFDAIEDFNPDHIRTIVEFATDSVDLWVQRTEGMAANDLELEQKIQSHPLMMKELTEMHNAIEYLATDRARRELIDDVCSLYSSRAVGSIY